MVTHWLEFRVHICKSPDFIDGEHDEVTVSSYLNNE